MASGSIRVTPGRPARASACRACRSAPRSSARRFKSNRLRARPPRFSYGWPPLRLTSSKPTMHEPSLRILLADDHVTVRHGLKLLIDSQPEMKVVSEASDGHAAVQNAVALKPDVIVMDISMPGMNGLEATRKLKQV